jgi:Fungal specific transcription factor domain
MGNSRYSDVIEQDVLPRNRGRKWGERATLLALESAHCPTLATVQTFMLVSLFWFFIGDVERCERYSGFATRVTQVLGLHRAHELDESWIDQELKTRIFWYVYQVESFATLKPGYVDCLKYHCKYTPLPSSEAEFASKTKSSSKIFRLGEDSGSDSVYGEQIQMILLWFGALSRKVNDRHKIITYATRKSEDIVTEVVQLRELETLAHSRYEALPPHLKFSSETFEIHSKQDIGGSFIYMHLLYHASLTVLYYSLTLSTAVHRSSSSISVSLLTHSAIKHADYISDIVSYLLGPSWDISRTPGIFGYFTYIASVVQLSYIWSTSVELQQSARENIQRNMDFLGRTSRYAAISHVLVSLSPQAKQVYENTDSISASLVSSRRVRSPRTCQIT